MISLDGLKNVLITDDVYFSYSGKNCGIETETVDSVTIYSVWFGEDERKYDSFDKMVNDPFFKGKRLSEIIGSVEIKYV